MRKSVLMASCLDEKKNSYIVIEFKFNGQEDSKAFPKWIQSYAALMETVFTKGEIP